MLEASDGQLVAEAAAGDDSAFDELVSRYRTRVYYLALSKVRGRDNALDVAQEAFVQAYLSLRTLREPDKFSAWLSSITANLCKMSLRRSSEVPMPPEVIDELRVQADLDPNAALAREALDRLPNGTRSAAVLYFVEEMKQAEIAEFLGISLAAVKSRIRDARSSLQKEMIHMVKQTASRDEPGDEFTRSLKHRLELARWYREFSEMIDAGRNLGTILATLKDRDYSEPVKQATARLSEAVWVPNTTFADELAKNPEMLMPEVLGLIRAGEHGGMMDWASHSLLDLIDLRNVQESVETAILCRTAGGLLLGRNPLSSVLKHAVEIAQSKLLRQVMRELQESVECGAALATVVERYSELLPLPLQIAVIVGEKSETLGYALNWAAEELSEQAARLLSSRKRYRPVWAAAWIDEGDYQTLEDRFRSALAELGSTESEPIRSAAEDYLKRLDDGRASPPPPISPSSC